MSVFDDMIAEANSWSTTFWDGVTELTNEVLGVARSMHNLGRLQMKAYDRLPLLLSRLRELGVRNRAIAYWNSAPREAHDKVSIEFMEEEGKFRDDIDDMHDQGGHMSARLENAVDCVGRTNIDDVIQEAPHARAQHVRNNAPGCI